MACLGAGAMTVATLVSPAVEAKGKDPVVYRTVAAHEQNSFFDITTLYHPQLGQSVRVEQPLVWKSLEMGVVQVKLVTSPDVLQWLVDGRYDEDWFISHMSDYRVKGRVSLEIWRYDESEEMPRVIDLTDGFTRVHSSAVTRNMLVGGRVTFPLKGGVRVTPGRYFVVVGVRFADPRVFNLRFAGQQSGTNTMGGYDHDHPVRPECADYEMTEDAHPGGKAYRPQSNVRPVLPDWVAPFSTTFEVVLTKAMMPCDMTGVYDPNEQIWNPGDIAMVMRGSRG